MISINKFICPNCKKEYEDIQDYGLDDSEMEGYFKVKCIGNCNCEFEVEFVTEIKFKTY